MDANAGKNKTVEYKITSIAGSAAANYELLPYAAKLEIRNASLDSFMIDGIPAISYYGD